MTIPEVRRELYELATSLGLPRLKELSDELERRKRAVPVKPTANRMTREIEGKIKALKGAHPDWAQHRIGAELGVGQGRVSEVLSGFRK